MEWLVDWLEEHQEVLKGSKSAWMKKCRKEVFNDHPIIINERLKPVGANVISLMSQMNSVHIWCTGVLIE